MIYIGTVHSFRHPRTETTIFRPTAHQTYLLYNITTPIYLIYKRNETRQHSRESSANVTKFGNSHDNGPKYDELADGTNTLLLLYARPQPREPASRPLQSAARVSTDAATAGIPYCTYVAIDADLLEAEFVLLATTSTG